MGFVVVQLSLSLSQISLCWVLVLGTFFFSLFNYWLFAMYEPLSKANK